MRALRHGVERGDLVALFIGCFFTLAIVAMTVREGTKVGTGSALAFAAFLLLVAAWLLAPQVIVGLSIPLFAVLPTAKVFVSPLLGPVKDVVTVAAGVAILITVVQREQARDAAPIDRLLVTLVVGFLCLYVVNLGGSISGSAGHGIAWAQGVRLVAEPMILLLAGLMLRRPQRTLHVAVSSLIGTGVFVALYGLYQQHLGSARLVSLGYSYNQEVRTIGGGYFRSFGTLDDPFGYAAFLLLALSATLFWMRRGPLKTTCLSLITIGLAFSYVRTAILIVLALVALWLVRKGRVTTGLLLLAASVAAGIVFLIAFSGASETRSVRAGPNTYLTLNGRTEVWGTIFGKPSKVPFGLGVGKIGTAAERAQSGVVVNRDKATKHKVAVDSGYFAAVADVGLIGFAFFLTLLIRLVVLGIDATKRPGPAGWLVLGWLIVLLLDAVTRASFTGFPTAFLGMLLVGLGIAASRSQSVGGRWR